MRKTKEPRLTVSKLDSICPQSNRKINAGDPILYVPEDGAAYHIQSPKAIEFKNNIIKASETK